MEQGNVTRKIAALVSRPELWLALLLVWILISAARSLGTPWAQAAGTEALRWGAGIGIALALSRFGRQPETAGQVLVSLTGAMALFGILGSQNGADTGLVGPYHDHQLYGSVLLLLLPFTGAFALSARSGSWRWGALAALTAGTLCLLLSQTRSAWIGMAAASAVFGWLWLSRPASRPRQWRVVLVPLTLLLLGLLCVWLLTEPADQQAAVSHRAATLTALPEDESWQSRLRLWRGTAKMVAAHPTLGIGLGRYPGSQWRWTHSGSLLSPVARPSLSNEAHSFYGQTTAEIGLVGLALYFASLAAFAVLGLRRLRKGHRSSRLSRQNALLIAALSAVAGQSVDALASPSWQFPEVSFFFWGILGLGLASLRREEVLPDAVPASSALRRFGQLALAGGLAVVLTAQILPIGLLTPVEAYTAPAGSTLISVTVSLLSPATPVAGGSTLQFQVLAKYKTSSGAFVTQDVTSDAGDTYGGVVNTPAKNYGNGSFSHGALVLSTATYAANSKLTVTVFYRDAGTAGAMYSNALVVPIQP